MLPKQGCPGMDDKSYLYTLQFDYLAENNYNNYLVNKWLVDNTSYGAKQGIFLYTAAIHIRRLEYRPADAF